MKNTSSIITTFDDALSYNCTQEELASPAIVSNRTEWSIVCNQTLPEDQCRPQASLVVINSVVNFIYSKIGLLFWSFHSRFKDSLFLLDFHSCTYIVQSNKIGKIQNTKVGNTDEMIRLPDIVGMLLIRGHQISPPPMAKKVSHGHLSHFRNTLPSNILSWARFSNPSSSSSDCLGTFWCALSCSRRVPWGPPPTVI